MRESRPVAGKMGQSRALVPQPRRMPVPVRDTHLVVAPPHPLPLTLRARRSFSKLCSYGFLAMSFILIGYGARDPDIRRAIDYRLTLLRSPGLSTFAPTILNSTALPARLPSQVLPLFADGRKGPRADRFAYAMNFSGMDSIARRSKTAPLNVNSHAETPVTQQAAVAGAALFLTALNHHDAPALPAAAEAPRQGDEWAGLLRNASLSPEQPKTIFGGLTEDEFRARELRCMATAIYFEARDEPIKGQIAVAQVIMNRIRSPFYPKTICGVVYQGERNRHGCQFSFTCNGRRNHVSEKPEWATAVKLAKKVIAGEVWLDEVGYATHYHATYVKPDWRRELDRVTQIGNHIFYKMKPGTVQVALLSEGL